MNRTRAIAIPALLAAALLVGCGGDEDNSASVERSVAEVASAGEDQTGETVTVDGRAFPIADIGFALAGDEAAVLVTALPTEIAKLSDGEQVRVQGRLEPIGEGRALRLDQEATDTQGLGLPDEVLAELQLDEGAPVIDSPSITGEDGPVPGDGSG